MGMVPTSTVGQTVSSPYYDPGTVISSDTGQVLTQAPGPISSSQTTSPAPSGGGGNPSLPPPNPQATAPSFQKPFEPTDEWARANTGMSLADYLKQNPHAMDDQINQQINDTFNAVNGYLDQEENTANQNFPLMKQNIEGQFTTNSGQLGVQNAANNQQFDTQQNQADYQNQNALANARNMYNELRQGYQQRFGGSTSAGDAANQIASLGQQRQEGQLNQGYQQATTAINNNRTNTTAQYQQSLSALTQQRDSALNNAMTDFHNQILQIGQSRAQNAQAKGQASLSALQQLQQQVFAINQQATSVSQQMALQQNQGDIMLRNYQALSGQGTGGGASALSNYAMQYGAQPTSNLQAGGYQTGQNQTPAGAIYQNGHYYDPLSGQMLF